MMLTNKFWGLAFVVGVFVLSIFIYAIFTISNKKTEVSATENRLDKDTIIIDDKGFVPQTKKIAIGTSIKWINTDLIAHRVTFGVNASLENLVTMDQDLKPADTLTYKFEKVGSFNYYDKKSGFNGTVEVK